MLKQICPTTTLYIVVSSVSTPFLPNYYKHFSIGKTDVNVGLSAVLQKGGRQVICSKKEKKIRKCVHNQAKKKNENINITDTLT